MAAYGLIFTALTPCAPAAAQESQDAKYGWREVWTGADAMRDVWLLYTGITLAPWSDHVYDPGWRLRVQSGVGQYDYTLEENGAPQAYRGAVNYVDALAGYHWQSGSLSIKLFAGVSFIDHEVRVGAARGRVVGPDWGPKVTAELWLDITPGQWTSLNFDATKAHNTVSARWRHGVGLAEGLAVGPELRLDTNAGLFEGYGDLFDDYEGRAGLFALYRWGSYELSFAGGVAAYVSGSSGEQVTPYGTLNFLTQF